MSYNGSSQQCDDNFLMKAARKHVKVKKKTTQKNTKPQLVLKR